MRPETAHFLDVVRDAERGTKKDEERVFAGVAAAVAAGGAGGSALVEGLVADPALAPHGAIAPTPTGLASMAPGLLAKIGVGVAFTALAIGGMVSLQGSSPGDERLRSKVEQKTPSAPEKATAFPELAPTPDESSHEAGSPPSSTDVPPSGLETRGSEVPKKQKAAGKPPPVPGSLARELEFLHQVQAALAAGDGARALRLLDGHKTTDRQFASERDASRIFALCQLKRTAQAKSATERFRQRYPESVHRAAIDSTCGFP